MNKQDHHPYFLFTTDVLSRIKDQFFRQKRQAITFTEQLILNKDLSYIPKILSCFPIEDHYIPQLDTNSKQFIQLQRLDADVRRLFFICEILAEEEKLPESKLYFLEQINTFDDLIQKYIRITFLLRRLEFPLHEAALKEVATVFKDEQVSICALRKIIDYEIFADKENKYKEILEMKMEGGVLK